MQRVAWIVGAVLACALVGAKAEQAEPEMTLPRVTLATVDWGAAGAELSSLSATPRGDSIEANDAILAQLNAAAAQAFPGIDKSNVPVLLPVDVGGLLKAPAGANTTGFRPHFFLAGPTGYDAAFTLTAPVASEISGFETKEEPLVLISASSVLYELGPPVAPAFRPSNELEPLIPNIRRRWLENYLRYSFERYGVTYTVSMLCFEGAARKRLMPCDSAAHVIARFIRSLRLAGGAPQPAAEPVNTIERPTEHSPDFTYNPPGNILANTGVRGHGGRADTTVYANIRFPLARAPAYANSQSFLNWGNCDFTGRTKHNWSKAAAYRCRVNDKPLVFDESAPENRSYPWRDNFCEHRRYFVGQCPGGEGHQGQDIRPATCQLRNQGADRCIPFRDDIVAVRDGMLLRVANRESVFLFVNAPGERLRVRYLHMHPKMLDADGVVSGRAVREGEVLGKAGNYDRIPNGTTYHLHFELQVPTGDGWVFVNPYMTLIASYERLIGGRGRQVDSRPTHALGEERPQAPEDTANAGAAIPPPDDAQMLMRRSVPREHAVTRAIDSAAEPAKPAISKDAAGKQQANAKTSATTRACTEKVPARSRQRDCASHHPKSRAGANSGFRKLGQPVPPSRAREGRVRGDIHTRDGRPQAGHVGVRASQ